jgi:hypothetical protein
VWIRGLQERGKEFLFQPGLIRAGGKMVMKYAAHSMIIDDGVFVQPACVQRFHQRARIAQI